MAQVGQPVLINGRRFREYQIEQGDTLSTVCLKFGVKNWKPVYDSPENAAFRQRFPDPDVIQPVTTPHFFIPLIGTDVGGKKLTVTLMNSFAGVVLKNADGGRLAGFKMRLVLPPPIKHEGLEVETLTSGEFIIPRAAPDASLTSAEFELVTFDKARSHIPPVAFDPASPLPDLTPHFKLKLNEIVTIVPRRVFYLFCPMCGVKFKTVKRDPSSEENKCPNDNFVFTALETEIETNETSFSNPATNQDPQVTPKDLKCRNATSIATAHGPVNLYFDESRFVLPDQGNYTLAGLRGGGAPPLTQTIIGRLTWGARDPVFTLVNGKQRIYGFHKTDQGASMKAGAKAEMFTTPVPSNETHRLGDNLFRWITVHHSADPPLNSFETVRKIQIFHQDKGIGGDPAADVAYHFVIDADGTIFEGRPLGIKGSHVPAFNGGNIGIVLAGDFERSVIGNTPTPAQLASLDKLVDILTLRFNIKSVWHHHARELQVGLFGFFGATDCPGERLIPHVDNVLRVRFPGPPP